MDFARLVDRGTDIAILVFFVLLGFGLVGTRRAFGSKADVNLTKRRGLSKLAAVLIAAGAVLAILVFWCATAFKAALPESLEWQAVTTTDGVLTVKMPGKPEVEVTKKVGELGPTRAVKQHVEIYNHSIIIAINEKHYLDQNLHFDEKVFLESMAQATLAQSKGKAIGERSVRRGGLEGKEISIAMPQEYTVVTQFFLQGSSLYQLKVVFPNAMGSSPIVAQYFNSLTVDTSRVVSSGDSQVADQPRNAVP